MQIRASPGRRDGFRLTPLRMCSCGWGLARACLSCVPWSIPSGRPAESRQRHQAYAQRRGDRDSGRARRGFSRPPSGLKWPRGVSSFMTQPQRAPARTSPGVSFIPFPSVVQSSTLGTGRHKFVLGEISLIVHLRAALLEDHANVEPRIPMARARARARGAAGRFWPN